MRSHLKSSDVTDRLLNECLRPNAEQISETMLSGLLACVVFEPDGPNAEAATSLGWDGKNAVFAMKETIRDALARLIEIQDPICASWLRDNPKDHLFVLIKHGLLLVNYDRERELFQLIDPPEESRVN